MVKYEREGECMKKMCVILGIVLSLVLLLASCSFGINKRWHENSKTIVSINFGGSIQPTSNTANKANRALVGGSSFLYIIMLPENSSNPLYFGPYEVTKGANFTTSEIPPGIYTKIQLINSASKVSNAEFKNLGAENQDGFITDNNSLFTQATSTALLLESKEIKTGRTTTLSATLLPLTGDEIPLNAETSMFNIF